jgi:purine-binding chemotaxis protein CheW
VSEYVTFRLDGQRYATRIDMLREVVRLAALVELPGMRPPVVGVLDLRGTSLLVVDVRRNPAPEGGDVLVVGTSEQEFGLACDRGTDVAGPDELVPEPAQSGADTGHALPPYVEGVLRGPDGAVFLVDVRRMAAEYADSLDVALEDGALREPGQALANALGASLPDSVDGL